MSNVIDANQPGTMDGTNYTKSSRLRRFVAFYIDHAIFTMIVCTGMFLTIDTSSINEGKLAFSILFGTIFTLAFYLCKDCFNGVSIGRWVMGIAVRDEKDLTIIPDKKRLIMRNLTYLIWPIECVVLLFSQEKKRIGDKIANTEVVVVGDNVSVVKGIIIGVSTLVVLIMLIFLTITQTFKHSEAYNVSLHHIEQSEEIQTITNGIKGYGWFPQGNISLQNGRGQAGLMIKVIGNTKNVIVYVDLTKERNSNWIVRSLNFYEKVQ